MNVLLLCTAFDALQYRVLRCAAAFAHHVLVLGPASAQRLARSRFCAGFVLAASLEGSPDPDRVRRDVDQVAAARDVGLVVPGDGRAVRLLGQLGRLRAPSYPVPDPLTFDRLADKWRFAGLCSALGLRAPPSRLYQRREELAGDLAGGALATPLVVKPTDQSGGRGVHVLRSPADARLVRRLSYRPLLVQPFVDGQDICLSAFCRAGRILHHVVYRKRGADCIFESSDELVELAGQVIAHVGHDGVINFDARLDGTGRIHMIECNPRFWYTMDMTLLAGLNFVRLGCDEVLPGPRPRIGAVLKSKGSLVRSLGAPWTLTALDVSNLLHKLRDPIPPLYDLLDRLRRAS